MTTDNKPIDRVEEEKARYYANFKSGASWFFWLGAISLVNMIMQYKSKSESPIRFAVGFSVIKWLETNPVTFIKNVSPRVIAMTVGVLYVVILVGLGLLARRRNKPAYLVGTILYALDIIPGVLLSDMYAVVFHLIVIGFLIWGFVNFLKLEKLEAEYPDPVEPEVIVIGPDKE